MEIYHRSYFLLLMIFILSSCSAGLPGPLVDIIDTSQPQIMSTNGVPSGKCVQYLECSSGLNECRAQASDICPDGYHTYRDSDIGPDFSDFAKQHFEGAREGIPHMAVTCDD